MKMGEEKQCNRNTIRRMCRWKPVFEMMCSHRCVIKVRKVICKKEKKKRVILRRVTGGAKGLGEHIRSFTTDEQYTPKARTISNLIVKIQEP